MLLLGCYWHQKKKEAELREELKGKGKETLDSAKEMTVEDYQKLISETIDSIKNS